LSSLRTGDRWTDNHLINTDIMSFRLSYRKLGFNLNTTEKWQKISPKTCFLLIFPAQFYEMVHSAQLSSILSQSLSIIDLKFYLIFIIFYDEGISHFNKNILQLANESYRMFDQKNFYHNKKRVHMNFYIHRGTLFLVSRYRILFHQEHFL
jgi:hypothetical protein